MKIKILHIFLTLFCISFSYSTIVGANPKTPNPIQYFGQIKTTSLKNGSYYWIITVPVVYGKNNEKKRDMEFIFDSGFAGTIYLDQKIVNNISSDCKKIKTDKGELKLINIFGTDVHFVLPNHPKFGGLNVIGLSALGFTKSSIVKNHGQEKFKWTSDNNIKILPNIIYNNTFDPSEGQSKFNVSVDFGLNNTSKRQIIFDTGMGSDYLGPPKYLVSDRKYSDRSSSAKINFSSKYTLKFSLEKNNLPTDLVGYKNFLGYQIVFSGKGEKKMYWAIADK